MKNRVLLLLILMCSVSFSFAQSFEYQTYYKDGKDLKYRILYPNGFDSSKEYPVLLFLHGAGEREDDNEKQLVHGSQLFLDQTFRSTYQAVVIFPQCPQEDYWSNAIIDRTTYPIKATYQKNDEPNPSLKLVMNLIDSIYALDYSKNDQMYLGGLSMGGMGTYELLFSKPEMFAAAFAICGGGYPDNVASYKNTALWVFHGTKDNVVPPSYSTKMVLAMQEAGGEVRYTLYPEANHNSWDPAFAEPELFPWLFRHVKAE